MTNVIPLAKLPRGIRNNNPGNLRHGDPWQGLSDRQPDTAFCTFEDPIYGLRALMKVLLAYRTKHKLRTIAQAIARWAPPNENDTPAYIATVARRCGVDQDAAVDWSEPKLLALMARAIVTHENGRAPSSRPADWYEVAIYARAAALATGKDA
ncbi:structural protein [Azospirillum doebereinerae]|uniref:structural protein n=1 Tax=Azospirillum doebereinerae TaxID=92933 RepID=UPI001EE5C90E|nr:structural protein [Azospirillum doebereinerae]MCG5241412.1 structural protein [Azospirillum doebereinerae]